MKNKRYLYDVKVLKSDLEDGKIPEKYKDAAIEGYFHCDDIGLKTLENCPSFVKSSFQCGGNELTSLEGGPQKVLGFFGCARNKLKNLKGCPVEVDTLVASKNELTSLEGSPQKVLGDFWVDSNPNLKSLEGAPKEIGGKFRCEQFSDEDYREYIKFSDLRKKLPEIEGLF